KIAFGFFLGFFPVTLAVLAGIRQVPATLVTVAVSMGAKPWTIFRKVMLPAMASTVVGGRGRGLGVSVVGVLVGELLGARAGLGYVINYAYGLMMTAEYAALVVLVAAAVLLLDGAGALIEARGKQWAGWGAPSARLFRWRRSSSPGGGRGGGGSSIRSSCPGPRPSWACSGSPARRPCPASVKRSRRCSSATRWPSWPAYPPGSCWARGPPRTPSPCRTWSHSTGCRRSSSCPGSPWSSVSACRPRCSRPP